MGLNIVVHATGIEDWLKKFSQISENEPVSGHVNVP